MMKKIKDSVVIEEGGMRYVMERTERHDCRGCVLADPKDKDSSGCDISMKMSLFCNKMEDDSYGMICTSSTHVVPITPEPRIYHAWDREDARGLVGGMVEYHGGGSGDIWKRGVLSETHECGTPFEVGPNDDPAVMIREIPKITMSRAEAGEKYGIPKNVIIEGV